MKKPLLLAAALLLGTSTIAGVALATPRSVEDAFARWVGHDRDGGPSVAEHERFRLADRDHRRRDESRGRHREHHDDDDDDDDDDHGRGRGGDRAGRPGMTGPTDPNAPVPDNGLFQGKARPKVEVN